MPKLLLTSHPRTSFLPTIFFEKKERNDFNIIHEPYIYNSPEKKSFNSRLGAVPIEPVG